MDAVRDFEERYAERSGVTVAELHERGRWGAPCECGEDGCEGFQMLYAADDVDMQHLRRLGLDRFVGHVRTFR